MKKVGEFRGIHEFLSNFWPVEIAWDGVTYPTSEHAFQAAKSLDPTERQRIAALRSPGEAKRAGRTVALRPDWENVKVDLMAEINRIKYAHADLRDQLLATGDAILEEGNTWGDKEWGVSPLGGKGKNLLGKILMQIRNELRAKPASKLIDWSACEKCRLHERRHKVVYGAAYDGSTIMPHGGLLVIGDAPGRHEDDLGTPFIGPAGELLRKQMLEGAVDTAGVFFTYAVGCRPPGGRPVQADEFVACAPRVQEIVDAMKPGAVLFLGAVAEKAGKELRLEKKVPTVDVVSPAALIKDGLHKPATKKRIRFQVARIKRLIDRMNGVAVVRGDAAESAAECAHDPVTAGHWIARTGATAPIIACRTCGVVVT